MSFPPTTHTMTSPLTFKHHHHTSPRGPSPFLSLGPDLFERILSYLCDEPFPHTALSTDGIRLLLPFALTCTGHYALFTRLTRRLTILPLGFTSSFRPPSPHRTPVPFSALFSCNPSPSFPIPRKRRSPFSNVSPLILEHGLRIFPNLTSLHLSRAVKVTDSSLRHVATFGTALRELRLPGNAYVTVDGLSVVAASCFGLRKLDLAYCKRMGDEAAPVLRSMRALAYLDVSNWKISDAFVAEVATIPTLASLSLSVCTRLTRDACASLARSAKNVQEVKLRCASGLRDGAVRELVQCAYLRSLDLSLLSNISDDGIAALGEPGKLPGLHTALLSQCSMITNAGVKLLARNKAIRCLDLSHCNLLTDGCADAIRSMTALEKLDMSGCNSLTDRAVVAFAELPCLTSITLRYCFRLTDLSADAIARSPSVPLRVIDVRKCPEISVRGMEGMRKACTSLRV